MKYNNILFKASYTVNLTLHACNSAKEFACRDAACVSMQTRWTFIFQPKLTFNLSFCFVTAFTSNCIARTVWQSDLTVSKNRFVSTAWKRVPNTSIRVSTIHNPYYNLGIRILGSVSLKSTYMSINGGYLLGWGMVLRVLRTVPIQTLPIVASGAVYLPVLYGTC